MTGNHDKDCPAWHGGGGECRCWLGSVPRDLGALLDAYRDAVEADALAGYAVRTPSAATLSAREAIESGRQSGPVCATPGHRHRTWVESRTCAREARFASTMDELVTQWEAQADTQRVAGKPIGAGAAWAFREAASNLRAALAARVARAEP